MTDVLYIKVRENRRVMSKACHFAIGVDSKGFKTILGFMISDSESEDSWHTFYQSMINRGLGNVEMVISDAHQGQVKAIQKSFTESVWQRCQVHFLRNVMDGNCNRFLYTKLGDANSFSSNFLGAMPNLV